MLPLSIQSDTSERECDLMVAPRKGRMLGWSKCFQPAASLYNGYKNVFEALALDRTLGGMVSPSLSEQVLALQHPVASEF
jgi:hypothetical protein